MAHRKARHTCHRRRVAEGHHLQVWIQATSWREALKGARQRLFSVSIIQDQHAQPRRVTVCQARHQRRALLLIRAALLQPDLHALPVGQRLAHRCGLGFFNEHIKLLPKLRGYSGITLQGPLHASASNRQGIDLVRHGTTFLAEEDPVEEGLVDSVPGHKDYRAPTQDGNGARHRPLIAVEHLGTAQNLGQLPQRQRIGHT
ncbi:hypothetical protein D3C81_787140 [compost metagenome]